MIKIIQTHGVMISAMDDPLKAPPFIVCSFPGAYDLPARLHTRSYVSLICNLNQISPGKGFCTGGRRTHAL